MRINDFFKQRLGAAVKNPRWSWGALQRKKNRVFLRVWEDQIIPHGRGQKVKVYWKIRRDASPGHSERSEHLEAIRNGAKGYGVITRAVYPSPNGPRTIASFDPDSLLELGAFTQDSDAIYATIKARVPVSRIAGTRSRAARTESVGLDDLLLCLGEIVEGKMTKVSINVRKRCADLVRRARRVYRGHDGKLRCYVCGWAKPDHRISGDIVEIHHVRQIAHLPKRGVRLTMEQALNMVAPLCPCCHRISHSRSGGKAFTLDELKQIIPRVS